MVNQIITIVGILSVTLLLYTTPSIGLWALAEPSPFDQQVIFLGSDARHYSGSVPHITNNEITGSNVVPISLIIGANDTIATPSRSTTQNITPGISVIDVINSTYVAPNANDGEENSDRRIGRGIRDRINDVTHTVVMSNATVFSNATITNSFVDESTTTNNYTRFLEIIPDYVTVALAEIRAISPPSDPVIEIHTDIDTLCIANSTSVAECDINIRIR